MLLKKVTATELKTFATSGLGTAAAAATTDFATAAQGALADTAVQPAALGTAAAAATTDFATAAQGALADTAVQIVSVPTTANAVGIAGQMAYADGFLYVCIAANTWQRAILATW